MASTRLPGKVLLPIEGRPVLWHIVNRLRAVPQVHDVVIATGDRVPDDPIESFAHDAGIACFRGSEDDVLDRFYQAARTFRGDPVVRVTADCPLIDPQLVSAVVALYETTRPTPDLVSVATGAGVANAGFREARFPDGLDAEVIGMSALTQAWNEANRPSDREHVTAFIWRQPGRFAIRHLTSQAGDLSELRWTLDHPEDFEMITRIYDALYQGNRCFGAADVLAFLRAHPEVSAINAHLRGKEGYSAFWQEAVDA